MITGLHPRAHFDSDLVVACAIARVVANQFAVVLISHCVVVKFRCPHQWIESDVCMRSRIDRVYFYRFTSTLYTNAHTA